jgi:glycine C-acetyltransferase/8-amino-7-oxononanoate synthase
VVIAGVERDYFSGTGYLGLHNHPAARAAALEAVERFGLSTATSRGGYGEHPLYAALEAEARAFFASEAALYYASGYFTALLLAQGLRERYERAFVDDASHYSVFDGLRAAGKPLHSYRHLDPEALRESLRAELRPGERPIVFSDGVFPISGEIAPLPDYRAALAEFGGGLICLDDAHAAGVLGAHGRGTFEHFNLSGPDCVSGATLSKALGGYGGILPVPGALLAEINRGAKVYAGASPPPLPVAAASAAALRAARLTPGLLESLRANVRQARAGLRTLGWDLEESPVPILCLRARPGLDLARVKNELFERGVCVAHVTSYSSTPPGGCLRVAIFASHTPAQIERLLAELAYLL